MSAVKRVVIVGPAYPLRGGIAHFNESFCSSLSAKGVEAHIVSFYQQYPKLLFPGKSQDEAEPREVPQRIEPLLSSTNPSSWRRAAKHIVATSPDVVVIRFWLPFMGPALGTLARALQRKGIKVIGLVDNALPHEPRPFDKPLSTWFFRHCNAFLTLSASVAADLHVLAPGKAVHVHPHPAYDIFGNEVPRAEACLALDLDPALRYVLFFGFVRKYKGLDLLLEAFADRRLTRHNIRLVVAGEFYDDPAPYLETIARLGLTDRVVLHNRYIPTAEVRHYFCSAAIVAQTYRAATQSGVTQIAYHFGRPMLVTNVGGLPEIVPHGEVGYVCPPEPGAIADALVRFFDENREAEFTEKAHSRKDLFSWQHFTTEFLNFAQDIL